MKEVDARGLNCPEPIMMAKRALMQSPEGIDITVDDRAALENVTRFAKSKGYSVEKKESGREWRLVIRK